LGWLDETNYVMSPAADAATLAAIVRATLESRKSA
jgi:hypothetical protein